MPQAASLPTHNADTEVGALPAAEPKVQHLAKLAVEVLRADGARTAGRLRNLVECYGQTMALSGTLIGSAYREALRLSGIEEGGRIA